MVRFFLRRQIEKHKALIYEEAAQLQQFMQLLMKHRNTGARWSREERRMLSAHLAHLAAFVPILFVFLLPGGSLLLPVLAEVLDRRRQRRDSHSSQT